MVWICNIVSVSSVSDRYKIYFYYCCVYWTYFAAALKFKQLINLVLVATTLFQ